MNTLLSYIRYRFPEVTALFAALLAFIIYVITTDSSVSFWDCPEYVLTASSLQVGHPPGNPVWTLAMRIATIPFPATLHALVINICSGLLMALAVFFLARITYHFIIWVINATKKNHRKDETGSEEKGMIWSAIASAGASLCFAVLDSTWYSAVEAEVYAFSTFLTAFTVWLMLRWARANSEATRTHLLILIAYILGLSLGVHQLNLLCLSVLALIFIFRLHPRQPSTLRAWGALGTSFILVALILAGLMPGTIEWAAALERICVNWFELPYFSGVIIYAITVPALFIVAVWLIPIASRVWVYIILQNFLWLSGIFLFKSHFLIALALSILCASLVVVVFQVSRKIILTSVWITGMVWLGYSAVALILVRGYASPPVNEASPIDIFSLQRYINREQYGSKPLFYGPTPFSRPMLMEDWLPGSDFPIYSRYQLKKESPRFFTTLPEPRMNHRSHMLSHGDSLENKCVTENNHGYILSDYKFTRVTTPELDMWFPRITASTPHMLDSYEDWAGMTRENMSLVEISTAIDSTGKAVGKLTPEGERRKETALRPTYLQNIRFFVSYQAYYMYLRYLLWNFCGRQNDIPSTGEVDHGNFITGISPLDNIMLGDQSLMPPSASRENHGRHAYYGIPLLFGIAGIIFLMRGGRRGKRVMAIVTILFLMTGLAIVVYLNQTPGEPRERDYAFIGSYMAYCIWIAFGFIYAGKAIERLTHSQKAATITLTAIATGTFLLLGIENFPDHNRRGRFHTRDFTLNMLAGKEKDIIFSHGDNFTFPLWYAQEVEEAAPEATVIDLAYLATPEYVVNLMKQGKKGIKLTADASDIAFGAYSFTSIAPDADTTALPLIDILRELYSSREGNPKLKHSKAKLPGITYGDTLTINLRNLATSSGMIPFRTLMILDIVATNLEQPQPRPVSFLSHVKREMTAPVRGALRTEAFSDTYAPGMSNEEYTGRLKKSLHVIDSTARIHADDHPYIDPLIDEHVRRQRGALVRAARSLANEGDTISWTASLKRYSGLYPDTSAGAFVVADSSFNETIEAATLLLELRENKGDTAASNEANRLLVKAKREPLHWYDFYKSLPAWRRQTVSNTSRRLIKTIQTIDTLASRQKRADTLSVTNNYNTHR